MPFILYSTADSICTITLNRPDKRNAAHGPMARELRELFKQFDPHWAINPSDADLTVSTTNFSFKSTR